MLNFVGLVADFKFYPSKLVAQFEYILCSDTTISL